MGYRTGRSGRSIRLMVMGNFHCRGVLLIRVMVGQGPVVLAGDFLKLNHSCLIVLSRSSSSLFLEERLVSHYHMYNMVGWTFKSKLKQL